MGKAKGRQRTRPLKRSHGLAMVLLGLLVIVMAISLWDLTAVTSPYSDSQDGFDPFWWAVGLLALLTPIWLARVHRNAETLSGSHVPGSPAWTAGIWFVPLVGGFLAAGALRRVWERSGSTRTVPPRVWAMSWSVTQFLFIGALIAGLSPYVEAGEQMGGPPYTEDEHIERMEILRQHVWGFFVAMYLVVLVGGVCMGYAVLDLQNVQRTQSRATPGPAAAHP